jgi:hypothetical protein
MRVDELWVAGGGKINPNLSRKRGERKEKGENRVEKDEEQR